jgi:hypothetical protein
VLGIILAAIQPAGGGDRLLVVEHVFAVRGFVVVGGANALEPFAASAVSGADRPRSGVIVATVAKGQAGG